MHWMEQSYPMDQCWTCFTDSSVTHYSLHNPMSEVVQVIYVLVSKGESTGSNGV